MNRRALTIVELLVVIAIIVILFALLWPAVQVSTSGGKRTICQSNIRQIVLAMTNFHSAHQCFPSATGFRHASPVGSSDQLSAFVQLLPFMDQAATHSLITEGGTIGDATYAACPPLNTVGYEPWEQQIPLFVCESVPQNDTEFGVTHYGLCLGDRARNLDAPESYRGAFAGSQRISHADIGDGSSNTIMLAEIGARTKATKENSWAVNQPASILENPSECYELIDGNGQDWKFNAAVSLSKIGRGGHWADGRAGVGFFNTILPPQSPSASVNGTIGVDGIYSASGPHPGGINLARVDGSVTFIDSNIDCGDSSSPCPTEEEMTAGVPSPYGVWGALGTIDGGEIVVEY